MISIIGRGNVATHLFKALKGKVKVGLVNPHKIEELPQESEIIIIAVADNAITQVAEKIPQTEAVVAHTAGSVPLDVLKDRFKHSGVFYPLQTFTKDCEMDYSGLPIFIEASDDFSNSRLKELALLISDNVRKAGSEERKKLHLAAVFACNFTNAMAGIAEEIIRDYGLDFSTLFPLLKQTVGKLERISPKAAQTGPAVRGDSKVMEKHLQMLEQYPELQEIYSIISKYISHAKSL